MIITIQKRNGEAVAYDRNKIRKAIAKANSEVAPEEQIGDEGVEEIIQDIEKKYGTEQYCTVEEVQTLIPRLLAKKERFELAEHYLLYKETRKMMRRANTTDESILSLVGGGNREVRNENSQKNATLCSTQRDLIAGEVSKDLTKRVLLPQKISKAHEDGVLHFHDADYFLQPMFNCCLVNIEDILDNGTVMNGKLIESPKSFQVACTVMTQVISNVASNQYGGQSLELRALGKYIRRSKEKLQRQLEETGVEGETLERAVKSLLAKEVAAGVQTIQYQINTLMTTNGQSPFVTLFMELRPDDPYIEECAVLYEEVIKQRMTGIKGENGTLITPPFPKLIYVLDEHNCLKGGKYDWLTKLCVECSSKRMYPDYISAKKMRENYDGEVFSCMGCRSFLSPWKDENGNYKWQGRFNQGVVSLNLPQVAIVSQGDEMKFWSELEQRLSLCYEALLCRHRALKGVVSDVSPIHWQYGAIARLKKGETIDKLLENGYSTISLGYIGVYETTKLMTGVSHTEPKGKEFALKLMNMLRATCEKWKAQTGLGFGLYGTPAESLCYRFAKIDRQRFGDIPDVTDKGYYTNSYHVDVREKIDAFSKLSFESEFQKISSGGAISYVEIPNMTHNLEALEELVRFIYDNIQYAEFNTRHDNCLVCNFEGEVKQDGLDWVCPQCGNRDKNKLYVPRRTCGYIGTQWWNDGKTFELNSRRLHC